MAPKSCGQPETSLLYQMELCTEARSRNNTTKLGQIIEKLFRIINYGMQEKRINGPSLKHFDEINSARMQ